MKTLTFLFLIAAANCMAQAPDRGHVYFFHPTTGVWVTALPVVIDSATVCIINPHKFTTHDVTAGTHVVGVNLGSKKRPKLVTIPLTVEVGKDYYVQIMYNTRMYRTAEVYMVEVTGAGVQRLMEECKKDSCL